MLNDRSSGYLVGLHDPVIIREKDTYHVFGSGGRSGKPCPTCGLGHCGLYHDAGRDLIVYHAYDVAHDARPTPRLAELRWDAQG